jgi:hypothetical protein
MVLDNVATRAPQGDTFLPKVTLRAREATLAGIKVTLSGAKVTLLGPKLSISGRLPLHPVTCVNTPVESSQTDE